MYKLKTVVVMAACIGFTACGNDPLEQISTNNRCIDCDLTGLDLSGIEFFDTDLSGANLTNANLSRTVFSGVNLDGTNLTNANLTRAHIEGVDLSNTILTAVNFSRAQLIDVNLSGQKGVFIEDAESLHEIEVEGPTDIVEISGADYLELRISGSVNRMIVSNIDEGRVDIDAAKIGELIVKDTGEYFQLYSGSDATIVELELDSVGNNDPLDELRVDHIETLTLRNLKRPFIHQGANIVVDKLVASGVDFRECENIEFLSGEVTNFELMARPGAKRSTCEQIRDFGATRTEALVDGVDSRSLYADAQKRLQIARESIKSINQYRYDTFGVINDSEPPASRQIFRDLLSLRGEYADLPELQRFADPTSVIALLQSRDPISIESLDVSPTATEWYDRIVGKSHLEYQSERFKKAFYESAISTCVNPELPMLPRSEDLQEANGVLELMDASKSLDKLEAALEELGKCVRESESRYYANLQPDKNALIELTVAMNEKFQEQNAAIALAQEERRRERERIAKEYQAYASTYSNSVSDLYDLDEILFNAYIELQAANFALGAAGAVTSSEKRALVESLQESTATSMNNCLARWFVTASDGTRLRPNDIRDARNLKLIALMSEDREKPRNERRSLSELERASGIDLPDTFFEDFVTYIWRCRIKSVPNSSLHDGYAGLYTGGREE